MAEVAAGAAVFKVSLDVLTQYIMPEIAHQRGVKDQIDQLGVAREWLNRYGEEAYKYRKSDKNSKLYGNQIRQLALDAEDVIEEFTIKVLNHALRKSHTNLELWDEIGDRIININDKVKSIREKHSGGGTESSNGELSISSVEQKIMDRRAAIFEEICQQEPDQMYESSEKQVNEVIDLLTGEDKKLRVISIVGMGGVGKTTFSLKVFKDERVVQKFDCRAYVYISEKYTPQELFESIMKSCGSVDSVKCSGVLYEIWDTDAWREKLWIPQLCKLFKLFALLFLYLLRVISLLPLACNMIFSFLKKITNFEGKVTSEKVRAHLKGKKYLIVLDDIWDTDAWMKLKDAFPKGDYGSRVLLTTRHKRVAQEAKLSSTDNNNNFIRELSAITDEEKSWELFRKIYLQYYSSGLVSHEYFSSNNLEEIGKQMVEKCHGLPLAIVVLGSLLSSQANKLSSLRPIYSVWCEENIRSSWLLSQGDDSYKCPGILALSYDYLPYHLQPCFLYMSLFPGTSKIRVTTLFQYWIAEGLIESRNGGETLEDTAKDYLDELIDRSLIQVGKRRSDGNVSTCQIHGLLHGVSASESSEDEFSKSFGSIDEFNRKQDSCSRRVAVNCQEQNDQYLTRSQNPRIRSLMCHGDIHFPKDKFFSSFLKGFKSLRVLEFNGYTKGIDSLPEEVGKLIHLRYLRIGKTKLKNINTSHLRKLVHLQTLNLKGNEVVLDDQIWCLEQLRHLYLKNIQLPAANDKINWAKSTMNKLRNNINQKKEAGHWIMDGGLEKLSFSLRKLKIEECLASHSDNISRAVSNLTNLRSLALRYKTSIDEPVMNEEVPLASIQFSNHNLLISLHLKGHILNWPTNTISFPPQLCKLKLEWSCITEDPMKILENLASLRFLHLGLKSYTGTEMVCSEGGFVNLQTLELVSILTLQRWRIEGALASLIKLTIMDCTNLEMLPDRLQHSTKLAELKERMPHLDSRMQLGGDDWDKIKHIPFHVRLD
ncbi:hypothetical protein MKW92_025453 [Papaver armeniacum]|nr:hypothetical protein MKW92_025453 [Papaver armeniacum]